MPTWATAIAVFFVVYLVTGVVVATYLEAKTKRKAPELRGGAVQVAAVLGLIALGVLHSVGLTEGNVQAMVVGAGVAGAATTVFAFMYLSRLV